MISNLARRAVIISAVLLLMSLLVPPVLANDHGSVLALLHTAAERTEEVRETVELSGQSAVVLGSGIMVGLGTGVLVGSIVAYNVWNRRLS